MKTKGRKYTLLFLVRRSIAYNRMRVVITASALAIGVALTTALVGLSVGIRKKIEKELQRYGANILITPGAEYLKVGSGLLDFGNLKERNYLAENIADAVMARFSNLISDHAYQLHGYVEIQTRQVEIMGVDFEQVKKIRPWWRVSGEWPQRNSEILVGSGLNRFLKLDIGDEIDIFQQNKKYPLKMTGLLDTGGLEDELLILNLKSAQKILSLPEMLSNVWVRTKIQDIPLEMMVKRLKEALPPVEVRMVRQLVVAEENLLHKVVILMVLVTLAVLLTGGFSMLATMSIMVLERQKEIGILKALGSPQKTIRNILIMEGIFIGGGSGTLGFLVGGGISQLISIRVFGSLLPLPYFLVFLALGIGIGLALIASYLPIRSALDVSPVVSLRNE